MGREVAGIRDGATETITVLVFDAARFGQRQTAGSRCAQDQPISVIAGSWRIPPIY